MRTAILYTSAYGSIRAYTLAPVCLFSGLNKTGLFEHIMRDVRQERTDPLVQPQNVAGRYLKEVRTRLGLAHRDVQEASATLADQEGNPELYISAGRLAQVENEPSVPSVFKILSLSAIYGIDFHELLRRYGVHADRVHEYRKRVSRQLTHLVSSTVHDLDTKVTIPMRMDPRFEWKTTQLINRLVAIWGDIPAAFLAQFNPRKFVYGYVGLDDHTMFPLVRSGALVMIDGKRCRIEQGRWQSEYDRPIYFIERRHGYTLSWCELNGTKLTLIPHPASLMRAETVNFPDDAEVVGQVVAVAMRLAPE